MPNIDLKNYEGGREQAYVKHYLLKKYLSRWAYKTGGSWDPLVFIDGFAGPWGAKDEEFADSSFGIALQALTEAIDGLLKVRNIRVRGACIFVEKNKNAFVKLDAFSKQHSTDAVSTIALEGLFNENIEVIDEYVRQVGTNPFKFVFLDQKGWAATPMNQLKPFVQMRPCELLFTLMTSHLTRFVDLKELTPAYEALYGRAGVLEKIRSLPKGTGDREETAVQEYCKSLKDVCGFQFVSRAVIMDPEKEKVRYYLVFATNSLHGIDVFKSAEREATDIQNDIRFETHLKTTGRLPLPGLFDDAVPKSRLAHVLTRRYTGAAKGQLVASLLANGSETGILYSELFGDAMSFPLVFPHDLINWLAELKPYLRVEFGKSQRRKSRNPQKPSPFETDRIFVVNPTAVFDWGSSAS